MIMVRVQTGLWDAYFILQPEYGLGVHSPWATLQPRLLALVNSNPSAPDLQTSYVALLCLCLLWAATRAPRRSINGLLALFVLVYWIAPLVLGGQLSLYRSEAVLLPAVPLARKLPILLQVVVLAVLISSEMDVLFFTNTLV